MNDSTNYEAHGYDALDANDFETLCSELARIADNAVFAGGLALTPDEEREIYALTVELRAFGKLEFAQDAFAIARGVCEILDEGDAWSKCGKLLSEIEAYAFYDNFTGDPLPQSPSQLDPSCGSRFIPSLCETNVDCPAPNWHKETIAFNETPDQTTARWQRQLDYTTAHEAKAAISMRAILDRILPDGQQETA